MRQVKFLVSFYLCCYLIPLCSAAQLKWQNTDSLFQPLPKSVHVYYTDDKIDTGAFKAYYLIADLKDKRLAFTVDTTLDRRLTPAKFYERNKKPIAVVNCTFFSFETNRNLNTVVKNGKLVGYNLHSVAGRGKDTLIYRHPFSSAIGISKRRTAGIAYLYTDSSLRYPMRMLFLVAPKKDSTRNFSPDTAKQYYYSGILAKWPDWVKWKVTTAVGGGPVLIRDGQISISNDGELKFSGKALNDKHPRTAMGYTRDGKLIILVVQGRSESSGGATLPQEAQILKDLGCYEALNLDGGGSSCLLVNGKETIKPSDKEGQRAVPAVFLIRTK